MHFVLWSMYTDFLDFETSITCHWLLHTIAVSFKKHEPTSSCTSNDGFMSMCAERECNYGAIATILYLLRFICIPDGLHAIFRVLLVPFSLFCVSAFGQIVERAWREQRRNSAPLTWIKYERQYLLCSWINFVWTIKRKIYT